MIRLNEYDMYPVGDPGFDLALCKGGGGEVKIIKSVDRLSISHFIMFMPYISI